jgi:branched-subunit amino acid aminotransferase/4-amino-4-deoxychorismate lyase
MGGFKTANKLVQILARIEADERGMDEALLLDPAGEVVEATASNVFWIEGNTVCTTPLVSGALPGVARAVVLELCRKQNIAGAETSAAPARLQRADGVFLTNSALGLVEVGEFNSVPTKGSPLAQKIQAAYRELMEREGKCE